MPIAGAAFGASKALEEIMAEQMLRAQMEQRQKQDAQRLQMEERRLQELINQNEIANKRQADQDKRTTRLERNEDAKNLVGTLDDAFDPRSTGMDPEVNDEMLATFKDTPVAPRVREIPTLPARATVPEMAQTVSQEPQVGVRRLNPTGPQMQQRRMVALQSRTASGLAGDAETRRRTRAEIYGETGQVVPDFGNTPDEDALRRKTERDESLSLFEDQERIRNKFRPPATTSEDAREIAEQLVDGTLVPSMLSRRGNYNTVLAMANQISKDKTGKPYNAARAQTEFASAQRFVSAMNGPQQQRFRALAGAVVNTIDEVKTLSEELNNSGVPLANRAKLAVYAQTQGNSPQGQLAAQYIAAVNTLKEEFANLANGGYAPTESAWELANAQINGDFGVKQMDASLTEVQRLINFRMNAFNQLTPYGVNSANPVMQGGFGSAGEPPPGRTNETGGGGGGANRKVYDINGNLVVKKP